jgi:hypothetical protein
MNFIGLTHVSFFRKKFGVGCLAERAENTFRWPPEKRSNVF